MLVVPFLLRKGVEMSEIDKYILAFDEINALMDMSFQSAGENGSGRIKKIASDVQSILINAYSSGIRAAGEMTGMGLEVELMLMIDAVYKVIDGKDYEDRLIEHLLADDRDAVLRLVQSEYHRIWNTAVEDGADQFRTRSGKKVEIGKKWNTMGDDRVRDNHWYLDGVTVPFDDEFHTPDGDHGRFPGDFENADNNVNCRCWITLEIKYAG